MLNCPNCRQIMCLHSSFEPTALCVTGQHTSHVLSWAHALYFPKIFCTNFSYSIYCTFFSFYDPHRVGQAPCNYVHSEQIFPPNIASAAISTIVVTYIVVNCYHRHTDGHLARHSTAIYTMSYRIEILLNLMMMDDCLVSSMKNCYNWCCSACARVICWRENCNRL